MTEEAVEQRFVYAGKRCTTKHTLVCSWLPEGADVEADDVRLFPKSKGSVIGGIYTIKVVGDTSYLPNSVTFTGERATPDVVLAFEARDHRDGVIHTTRTLERNASRTSPIKELCGPLRELVGKQVGWANRAALLAYINSEISRG